MVSEDSTSIYKEGRCGQQEQVDSGECKQDNEPRVMVCKSAGQESQLAVTERFPMSELKIESHLAREGLDLCEGGMVRMGRQ